MVRGRLWRCSDPHLDEEARAALVAELMAGRRAVREAKRDEAKRDGAGPGAMAAARARIDAAKRALGERGPVWWNDGAPDLNRRLVRTTPYAEWHAGLAGGKG